MELGMFHSEHTHHLPDPRCLGTKWGADPNATKAELSIH